MILGPDGKPSNGDPMLPGSGTVEIVRSFAFKLNLGNYQSADFFSSRKEVCRAEDADEVSASIYEWCYEQVMDSVREVKAKQEKKEAAMARRSA